MPEALRSRGLGWNPISAAAFGHPEERDVAVWNREWDRLARAVLSLPERERLAVALAHGMGLSTEETAEAIAIEILDTKRPLADGFLELHRLLFVEPDMEPENSSET
jgi:DNA-directed RNA polymerase specialized sigma24 family protein